MLMEIVEQSKSELVLSDCEYEHDEERNCGAFVDVDPEQLVLVEPPRPAMIAKTSALVSTSEFIACITALLHDEPADEQ